MSMRVLNLFSCTAMRLNIDQQHLRTRDVYAGGQKEQLPPALIQWGAGGARIAVHTKLFPSLLYSERAFCGSVDSLVHKSFPGGKPPDHQIRILLLGEV